MAEAKHGFLERCYCEDSQAGRHCDRNFPSEESVAWARGVIDGLSTTEHNAVSQSEIDWYADQQLAAIKAKTE